MRATLWFLAALLACAAAASKSKVVCYWGSWSIYRTGDGQFNTSNIDPGLCTHLIYAFIGLDSNATIRILDPVADLPDDGGRDGYRLFNQLREKNSNLKTLIAIGGWGEGSANYSRMVSNVKLRQSFVQQAVSFVKKYKFNGLDLDWEYPSQRDGAPSDKENFVLLVKELREAFDKEGLLLSAAVSATSASASQSYDIPQLTKYLDFVNLMTYDFHGTWEDVTGSNAPLYAGEWESGNNLLLNVNASVDYWLSQGTPAEKLIVGVPFYGHGYTLANVSRTEIGAPSSGAGKDESYEFFRICKRLMSENWTKRYSKQQRVPFAFMGDQWISYDNVESVKEKARYIKKLGLGGAMVWSIESDDFRGICGRKYPLLKTLNEVLVRPGLLEQIKEYFESIFRV